MHGTREEHTSDFCEDSNSLELPTPAFLDPALVIIIIIITS